MKICKRCHKEFENKTLGENLCSDCWFLGKSKEKKNYWQGYNEATKKWD